MLRFIRNQESGIRNQESGIRNQESGVSMGEALIYTVGIRGGGVFECVILKNRPN